MLLHIHPVEHCQMHFTDPNSIQTSYFYVYVYSMGLQIVFEWNGSLAFFSFVAVVVVIFQYNININIISFCVLIQWHPQAHVHTQTKDQTSKQHSARSNVDSFFL